MLPGRIEKHTRILGKPADWDEAVQGPCGGLPIRDVILAGNAQFMVSAWTPLPDEIERIVAGEPIVLGINGTGHPVVFMGVGVGPTLGEE